MLIPCKFLGWLECVNDIAVISLRLTYFTLVLPSLLPEEIDTIMVDMLQRCFCFLYASLFLSLSFPLMEASELNPYIIYNFISHPYPLNQCALYTHTHIK
jgi:hypothetical protein